MAEVFSNEPSLLAIALEHLTLGRAALYGAILANAGTSDLASIPHPSSDYLAAAVDGLRESGNMDELPRGLLTRAWQLYLSGDVTGSRTDLDEAWEIAERGPMPLYQADILLTRARLFGRNQGKGQGTEKEANYPWGSAREDLAEAGRLIEKHGYHRRDEELADAAAIIG